MFPWIVIALIGVALAAAAYFFSPGRIRGGLLLTMLVGAAAAVCLTWLGRQVGLAVPNQTFGFLTAIVGTALVMAVWRTAMGSASSDS
jgi:uncharacterized membrane protein YeaQ/YmgE (transglycosylase-associated protein family)